MRFHRRQLGRSSGPKASELVDQVQRQMCRTCVRGHKWHEYLSLVAWGVNTATYSYVESTTSFAVLRRRSASELCPQTKRWSGGFWSQADTLFAANNGPLEMT